MQVGTTFLFKNLTVVVSNFNTLVKLTFKLEVTISLVQFAENLFNFFFQKNFLVRDVRFSTKFQYLRIAGNLLSDCLHLRLQNIRTFLITYNLASLNLLVKSVNQ